MKKTVTVKHADMQEIFKIACDSWKGIIANNFGKELLLGNDCEVTEELKDEMLKAATKDQKAVVEKAFGVEDILVGNSWFNDNILVRASREYKNKGFYLTDNYDWKIVTDSGGSNVLIPTKKK